jgi:hypothetical protein
MRTAVSPGRLIRLAIPGVVGWTAALGVFVLLFGADAVAAPASTLADPDAAPLVALGVGATVCWGLGLRRTLRGIGVGLHPLRAIDLVSAATFVNSVTPFGQTGGDPLSAVLVERTTGVEYERGLAAIVSVTGINRVVPLLVAGGAGTLYRHARPDRELPAVTAGSIVVPARGAVVAVGTLLTAVGLVGLVGTRSGVGRRVRQRGLRVSEWLPGSVRRRAAGVATRARRFKRALGRTLTSPATAGAVLVLGAIGEVALAGSLWGTLSVLGETVPLALALAAVPLSRIGAVAPTPGGAGGVEVALAGVLIALGGVPAPVTGVAALAFRLLTFAVPTVVGGGVVALVLTRRCRRAANPTVWPVQRSRRDRPLPSSAAQPLLTARIDVRSGVVVSDADRTALPVGRTGEGRDAGFRRDRRPYPQRR